MFNVLQQVWPRGTALVKPVFAKAWHRRAPGLHRHNRSQPDDKRAPARVSRCIHKIMLSGQDVAFLGTGEDTAHDILIGNYNGVYWGIEVASTWVARIEIAGDTTEDQEESIPDQDIADLQGEQHGSRNISPT